MTCKKAIKNAVHTGYDIISCLRKTCYKTAKKAFLFFCHTFTPFKAGSLPIYFFVLSYLHFF